MRRWSCGALVVALLALPAVARAKQPCRFEAGALPSETLPRNAPTGDAIPIDHMKAEARRTGERMSLSMRITEKSTPLPKRLRGLLVAPSSNLWQGTGGVVAIDVPLQNGG